MKKNILVTGASGFIGGHLCSHFLKKGCFVFGLCRNKPRNLDHSNFQWIETTITRKIDNLPKIDICIHAAALSPNPLSSPYDYILNNVVGTHNLLSSLSGNKLGKFFFLSGVAVYGKVVEESVDESTPIRIPSPYGISKFESERLLIKQDDFDVCILRMPGVLGRGAQNPWLVRQIKRIVKQETVRIYNPQSFFNNAVYIDDLINFIDYQISQGLKGKETFLIGADEGMSISKLISMICKAAKSKSIIDTQEGPKSFFLNFSKAKEHGYQSKSLEDMVMNQIKLEL